VGKTNSISYCNNQ